MPPHWFWIEVDSCADMCSQAVIIWVCACARVCVCSCFLFCLLSSAQICFTGMTPDWQENAVREANGIKVHYSLSINFMWEDRSNKHSEQSWNRMRLSHLQMDTSAAFTGTGCVDSCLRSLVVTFLTNSIYVTVIHGVTFADKPRAMGQIFSDCPLLLFVKCPCSDSYYYHQ